MSSLFRCEIKVLSKCKGQSAAAAHGYDEREKHRDKSDLIASGNVFLPGWAADDVGKFWAAADEFERENGMVARRAILSFPNQLQPAQFENYIKEWLAQNCPQMPASWDIHDDPSADPRNPHVHILISERMCDGIDRPPEVFFKRFNGKNPELGGCKKADLGSNRKDWLTEARSSWAAILNRHLPANEQVSHLSNSDRGLPPPTPKFGAKVLALEGKGIRTNFVSRIIENEVENEQNKSDAGTKSLGIGEESGNGSTGQPSPVGAKSQFNNGSGERRESGEFEANKRNEGYVENDSGKARARNENSLDNMDDYRRDDINFLAANSIPVSSAKNDLPLDKNGNDLRKDLTLIAIKKQLDSLSGVGSFEIGIHDQKTGVMRPIKMSAQGIINSLARLKKENARGCNIYIRPDRESNHPYVLMDDLSSEQLNQLELNGFDLSLVNETSPCNHQAIIKLPYSLNAQDRKEVERALQKRFGGDKNTCDGQHFFRLAGFTNRKEKHLRNGKFPFVLIRKSNPIPWHSNIAFEFMKIAPKLIDVESPEKVIKKVTETHKPRWIGKEGELSALVNKSHRTLQIKYGNEYDESIADYQIAKTLIEQGWNYQSVKDGIRDGSPNLDSRKKGHVEDYLNRTVGKAAGRFNPRTASEEEDRIRLR